MAASMYVRTCTLLLVLVVILMLTVVLILTLDVLVVITLLDEVIAVVVVTPVTIMEILLYSFTYNIPIKVHANIVLSGNEFSNCCYS